MKLSPQAENILVSLSGENVKLGDVRKIAREIKKDHDLASELWSSGQFLPRQLAILIMDKKLITEEVIDRLLDDMSQHPEKEKLQLVDWFMANQLLKDKQFLPIIENWVDSFSPLKRRIFWYHQGRLRWTGKTPPSNSDVLLSIMEQRIESEEPEVQWAMNFTAGWIGVFEEKYRDRCIALGENTGLYKGIKVPKNCTPDYLPEFIRIEAGKRNL
ncbi:MAG TPA: DNA alkylation repair protein [Membranihabitans sp.]|nr:DNA alkylation repair protein [Membranihabitans sp.]